MDTFDTEVCSRALVEQLAHMDAEGCIRGGEDAPRRVKHLVRAFHHASDRAQAGTSWVEFQLLDTALTITRRRLLTDNAVERTQCLDATHNILIALAILNGATPPR